MQNKPGFFPVFSGLEKFFILGIDIWDDPCYIEATRNPTPHRKEAANVRRSSQQKPMGSRERCKADHQDQPKPRPGAVRTLYQRERQPQRISERTSSIWTYQPEEEIKKPRQLLPAVTGTRERVLPALRPNAHKTQSHPSQGAFIL